MQPVRAHSFARRDEQDDTYDDILPAMGVVSELKADSLRIEESQMLAALLCHATMFVTPAEFHQCLTAVQQRTWTRMDRVAVLAAMKEAMSGEAAQPQGSPRARVRRHTSPLDQVHRMAAREPVPSRWHPLHPGPTPRRAGA